MSPAKRNASPESPIHPGKYVRDEILKPKNVSVTDAAKIIGISRPSLSNFLNGRVSTTPEMAARIERAFQSPAQTLLDMQLAYDAAQAKGKGAPANTKTYVTPFLAIKANAIEEWASDNISARTRFSVFLRTLIHSTGIGLSKVEFPGNDDAERPGWDGFVESSQGTPWIPEGISGWEFGTTSDVKTKADGDFAKSIKAISKEERKRTTFIFVTPRRWSGKDAWLKAAKAKGAWKDVRVYDSSNLEEWLEQSLAGQSWLASEAHIPSEGVRSLDKCWSDWADISTPPLTSKLFDSAIDAATRTLTSRLTKTPDRPIVIVGDSVEEALAFLAQLFSERAGDELAAMRDKAIVFDKPGVLPRLAHGAQNFIPIVSTREVERELAPFSRKMHCIIVYPRNASPAEPDFVLEPVSHELFRTALEEMGKDRDEISRLSSASGRSLTVLRRQVSDVPVIRTPEWAADHEIAARLVPFLFVGAWNSDNDTDRTALSLLADGHDYGELEKECLRFSKFNDAPMWMVGNFRGVISKIDLLFAIAGAITKDDLKRYFSLARLVLGEDDPALDLAEEDRWAASIHGKVREFSSAFRQGISETLVLLAVNGNGLFKARLGIDTGIEAAKVVRDLLPAPLTARVLEANDRDLPTYAEAAPETFLSILEDDLNRNDPAVLKLLRPVDSGIFGRSPSRTGLLWALEGLAWNPATLPRAASILAQLAQIQIEDNWVNKPTHSLESIFRAWMPQTAASHEARLDVIKRLAMQFPHVAWKLCVAQFGAHHATGDYTHKPRWRADGYGFGEPFSTWGPILKFQHEMVEMALGWPEHTLETLGDLVSRLDALDEAHQTRVWNLLKVWANDKASDEEKALLREKIRVATLSHRAARRAQKKGTTAALSDAAKDAYAALEPADAINKHSWLFRESWVEESYDETYGDEDLDYRKREERITALRIDAIREVHKAQALDGIIALAERGKAAWQIGRLCAETVLDEKQLAQLVLKSLAPIITGESEVFPQKNLVAAALRSLPDNECNQLIKNITNGMNKADIIQLVVLAPFKRSTWGLVDGFDEESQKKYWSEVGPDRIMDSDDEANEAVERLLAADRPMAAFACIHFQPEKLDPSLLYRLLSNMAEGGKDKEGHYQPEQYSIEQAFERISASPDLTLEQKAGLEFAYVGILARPWSSRETHGIPNLERYIELHPEVFVQALVWTYKRKDNGADPPEFRTASENIDHMAKRGYKLLDAIERIPGHDDLGELNAERLARWVKTVRDMSADLSRLEVADICIGKLLSSAPADADGIWPCEPVRQVMEDLRSKDVMQGAHTGLYNSRGAQWRGEGGSQERELADKYRKWAEALQLTHPYVSSALLMAMVRTYEQEASREDLQAGIRRRLQ